MTEASSIQDRYDGPLVSGASALTWSRWTVWLFAAAIPFAAVDVAEILLHVRLRDGWGFWLPFRMWVALALSGAASNVIQAVQAIRESRKGYTTIFSYFPNLVQIDPKTRRVVRRPGEPFLTARQARQAARTVTPRGQR